jgi:xanthine dehydrogenase large subunit
MFGIEYVLDDVARTLSLDPLDVRRRNFYGTTERNVTPYGMRVEDNVIHQIVDRLEADCGYRARRLQVAEFNASNPVLRKGLALTPLKFGIAFTDTAMNQAGALVHVYRDGTVMLHHGGTEMGQGLYTKVAQVVAAELRIPLAAVRCAGASTAVVPNTSATAASASSDLNGAAAMAAARQIRERLAVFAGRLWQVPAEEVIFHAGSVSGGGQSMTFAELANAAWLGRVSLSATGFYATPKIGYDRVTLTGRPFHYFVYGAAASEIVIDTLTGESRLLRVDILHDAGRSLNPAIDLGQIEGGFLQGVGWLTSEEVWWDQAGVLGSDSASTYKIPTATDWPAEAHIRILETGVNREATIYRSKGIGEPPLMHALSVFFALKDAVASLAPRGRPVRLDAPATPEAILRAVSAARAAGGS